MSPLASKKDRLIALAQAVLETEASAVAALCHRIDEAFVHACSLMQACSGRIVVIGMGKSGHIGGKIAATLASTGTPAFFVHPGEASHGDLGMITRQDVVLALSHSGETDEVLTILPIIKRLGVPLIALTGHSESTLAQTATVNLDVSVEKEACPLGLAPTASTTATLAMGDALSIALLEIRGFTAEDFARSHPAGQLGRRLLLHVADVMRSGEAIPQVRQDVSLKDALLEITQKHLGMTAILDEAACVVGVFTDGDLRRAFDRGVDLYHTPIADLMTRHCKTVSPSLLAVDALTLMENQKINGLLVVDDQKHLVGAFNMHDLLRARVM